MHQYEVGKPYSETRRQWPEVTEYNYRQGAHELRFFWNKISSADEKMFRHDKTEFALFVQQPVILFCYRFIPRLTWSDAPFSIHRVPDEQRAAPAMPEPFEERALLQIILTAAEDGIIRGLRAVTFSPEFTAELHAAISQQAATTWDSVKFDRTLREIYAAKSSEQIAREAIVRCTGGS